MSVKTAPIRHSGSPGVKQIPTIEWWVGNYSVNANGRVSAILAVEKFMLQHDGFIRHYYSQKFSDVPTASTFHNYDVVVSCVKMAVGKYKVETRTKDIENEDYYAYGMTDEQIDSLSGFGVTRRAKVHAGARRRKSASPTTTSKTPVTVKKKAAPKTRTAAKKKPAAKAKPATKAKAKTAAKKMPAGTTTTRKSKTTIVKTGKQYPYKKVELRQEWEEKGWGIPEKISKAAARVRQTGDSYAAGVLRREGVKAKKARMAKGALAGTPTRRKKVGAAKRDPDFTPTAAQKRKLPAKMLKGLIAYHHGK